MSASRNATSGVDLVGGQGGQAQRLDRRAVERGQRRHVAAAAVELDHLAQRARVAVVEVRRGQRHVAQRRDLERAVDAEALGHGGAVERGRRRRRGTGGGVNESGPNASRAPTPRSSSVGRTPMLLKPLSMTLPSRLRTGPFTAAATRRTEASVSSVCSWQFEQRRFVGPRVRSLNRCAPNSARRLMWLGADVGPRVQRRVGRRRMLAAEAVPRRVVGDERRLVELHREAEEEREVVLDQRVLVASSGSLSARVDELASCRPAFTRIRLVRVPPLLVERDLDHLVVGPTARPGCGQRLSGPSTLSVRMHLLLRERPDVVNPLRQACAASWRGRCPRPAACGPAPPSRAC